MDQIRRFIQSNADRLFAGFALIGSILIAKAGDYADNNGDAHNVYLKASGIIELVSQVILLVGGDRARPVSSPGFLASGLFIIASGAGLFGLSQGSVGEIASGLLWTAAAFMIFYSDRAFPKMKLSGALIGGWLYQACLVPLLISGIQHDNPFEWASALAFALSNFVISMKPKPVTV